MSSALILAQDMLASKFGISEFNRHDRFVEIWHGNVYYTLFATYNNVPAMRIRCRVETLDGSLPSDKYIPAFGTLRDLCDEKIHNMHIVSGNDNHILVIFNNHLNHF